MSNCEIPLLRRGRSTLKSASTMNQDPQARLTTPPWHDEIPRLSGESVDVREVVESDAATLFELLSDPKVTEHLSSPPPSPSAFAGFIRWARREGGARHGVFLGHLA